MGAASEVTPGSVWHCGRASSPPSTQLPHLPNGVGKVEGGTAPERQPPPHGRARGESQGPRPLPASVADSIPLPQVRSEPGLWEDQSY